MHLREVAGTRWLGLYCGFIEAAVMLSSLAVPSPIRPFLHDVAANIVSSTGGTIQYVFIHDLIVDGPFYVAEIAIEVEGKSVSVDARPSDAISLAIPAASPEARHTEFETRGSKTHRIRWVEGGRGRGGWSSAERDWETPLAVTRRGRSRVGRSAVQTVIADTAGGAKKAGNREPILRGSLNAAGSTPRVVMRTRPKARRVNAVRRRSRGRD